jgi:peptide/nickel transport system ATP-binding protein/peptide/nickel transport system permease protein
MNGAAAIVDHTVIDAPARPKPTMARGLGRRPLALACCLFLALLVGVAIVAPIALPGIAKQNGGDLFATLQGPSRDHLLGTDRLGRDVLDRLLVGTRVTMLGVGEALAVVLMLGVPLGLLAGFFRGWTDRVVGVLADLTFSVPGIIIVLVVLSIFPGSMLAGMITFGVLAAPGLMRVVRSATLPVREELYIAAARVSGLSQLTIIRRHVLPRIAGVVIVQASLLAAIALVVQTGLSFLNLLVTAPAPSWGGMVSDGVSVIVLQPWLIWPPGIAIGLTILALGLLGDAVRDTNAERWATPRPAAPRRQARRTPLPPEDDQEPIDRDGTALLAVNDLSVELVSPIGTQILDGVSFVIRPGEALGLVGESGCGKTITALSILGLPPGAARITGGHVFLDDVDLLALPERDLRQIRGRAIGFVSQEPMVSFDPVFTIGSQLSELVRGVHHVSRSVAKKRVIELLRQVHLPNATAIVRQYPHELSGGMAQRVAIARALIGEPALMIADEPTTALDVTVQAEILGLLRELQSARGMSLLLVTHDWGVVSDICDRAAVMYAGQIVEVADVTRMCRSPLHPYTAALLAASPHHAVNDEALPYIPGAVPTPGSWPSGCHFHPRCRFATDACLTQRITITQPIAGHETRCIHYEKVHG